MHEYMPLAALGPGSSHPSVWQEVTLRSSDYRVNLLLGTIGAACLAIGVLSPRGILQKQGRDFMQRPRLAGLKICQICSTRLASLPLLLSKMAGVIMAAFGRLLRALAGNPAALQGFVQLSNLQRSCR